MVVFWLLPQPAAAQHVPAGRVAVEAAFSRLDSTLAQHGTNSGTMSLRRLEDSTALLLIPLIRDMAGQLPDDVCGVLFTDPQAYTHDRFIGLLAQTDTGIVNRWMTLLEQSALANFNGLPEHPRPPQPEATAVLQRALKSQPPEDLRRLLTAMNSKDSRDQCWSARKLAGILNALPDEDQVLLMRSNFP